MDYVSTEYMIIDEHYLDVLGLELIAGENFNPAKQSALDDGLIINQTTVREMGWSSPEDAIGKRIDSPSKAPAGEVIGVVKDYHGLGLQEEIWPKAMDYGTSNTYYYAIRFNTGQTSDMLEGIRSNWKSSIGDYAFDYFFLDEDFDRQYRSEDRLMNVFLLFAFLTVVIASIGLLGLVSFIVLSRTREIGIRKVLGANTSGLVTLLSREFLFLVLAANVLIIPFVWYMGNTWLKDFAYHTTINPLVFTITLVIMLALTIGIVAGQTFQAARRNPVETLRSQ
jgi:putative ABC transport system permease protein